MSVISVAVSEIRNSRGEGGRARERERTVY